MEERESLITLSLLPGIGPSILRALLLRVGSANQILKLAPAKLKRLPRIGNTLAEAIAKQASMREQTLKVLDYAKKKEIHVITWHDEGYPERLRNIADGPPLLFLQGSPTLLNHKQAIGMVGTRKATDYGRERCDYIIAGLKCNAPLIVSGLAYGIDAQAHRSAIKHGLPTLGIVANGHQHLYPFEHRELAKQMIEQGGGILTEYPYFVKADPRRFPARNRIIAGMSDVVVVVEAAESGGALITAHMANGYHREVMAVPGPASSATSSGCHRLIQKNEAHLLHEPDDLLTLMNWKQVESSHSLGNTESNPKIAKPFPTGLSETQNPVFNLLHKEGALHMDEISWRLGLAINQTAVILFELEMLGLVYSMPGSKYKASN
jgi:DNA processing protein